MDVCGGETHQETATGEEVEYGGEDLDSTEGEWGVVGGTLEVEVIVEDELGDCYDQGYGGDLSQYV